MPSANTHPARTLVVGASGQLGTALVQQLGPAALPAARRLLQPDWLLVDLEHIASEPRLLDGLIDRQNITAVYCAAGATDVERCESDPAWASAANHLGPLALAQAARGIPFVFFSTDYVFDGAAGPYSEDATPNPLSIYGATKLAGERAILDAHPNALILRTTTVYGPDPQRKNFLYTLRRLLSEGKTMRVPDDQLATPTYNEDLAAAAIRRVNGRCTGLYHIAGPEFLSRSLFACRACKILGLNPEHIQPVATAELNQRAARPLLGGLFTDRLLPGIGADVMRSPDEGIRDWKATTA